MTYPREVVKRQLQRYLSGEQEFEKRARLNEQFRNFYDQQQQQQQHNQYEYRHPTSYAWQISTEHQSAIPTSATFRQVPLPPVLRAPSNIVYSQPQHLPTPFSCVGQTGGRFEHPFAYTPATAFDVPRNRAWTSGANEAYREGWSSANEYLRLQYEKLRGNNDLNGMSRDRQISAVNAALPYESAKFRLQLRCPPRYLFCVQLNV